MTTADAQPQDEQKALMTVREFRRELRDKLEVYAIAARSPVPIQKAVHQQQCQDFLAELYQSVLAALAESSLQRDTALATISSLEGLVARRPALDERTLYGNVAKAIAVAGNLTEEINRCLVKARPAIGDKDTITDVVNALLSTRDILWGRIEDHARQIDGAGVAKQNEHGHEYLLEYRLQLLIDERDAALARAEQAEASREWQPIETAPKDGSEVLLWWPYWRTGVPVLGSWIGLSNTWGSPWRLEGEYVPPTHWMPLPSPPVAKDGE